ncbi:MAG: glycosyltransferase family 2 protein [Brevefilum sp.]
MNNRSDANNPSHPAAHQTPEPLDLTRHTVCVVIPAFNEARFIGSVVLGLKRRPVEILVVDDGSSDDTAEIARAAGAEVLRLPANQGKGAALNAITVANNSNLLFGHLP